ncbi:hypothetical protein BDZ89DRAFT_1060198 [Hymenopellis radicata]|nr:hypothetical protein BDZ89DRAFT_1060198 [Hymenopellis radicata]
MSKYIKRYDSTYPDLSSDLHDGEDWIIGELSHFEFTQDLAAVAVDPVSGLLAAGTLRGTIQIFGRPGVYVLLSVPDRAAVKFLQISTSTFSLVCVDEHSRLHLWDLSNYGRPKYITSASFDNVKFVMRLCRVAQLLNSSVISELGEVRTYDLVCRRKSAYTAPNMWKLYADKMAKSGMFDASSSTAGTAIDAVIHPRNLNLLFVVYGGGVILCDLTERNTLRVYELIILPGAPGGRGFGDPDILMPRKPEVTSIAVHPAGHFFAVGYTDGIIAYWALEDEDQPLLVRTLDETDVHVIDADALEAHISKTADAKPPPIDREPIFKMSWSSFSDSTDPRGGFTSLVVLGGLRASDAPGVTVQWFPAFNPPEPPTPVLPGSLHPFFRSAMRDSVDPVNAHFYATDQVVQDYVLVPKSSPHFNNAFDPVSILIMTEAAGGTRAMKAQQFPPPSFTSPQSEPGPISSSDEDEDAIDELSSTLTMVELSSDPKLQVLPWTLSSNIMNGQLRVVERDAQQNLVSGGGPGVAEGLPLRGGCAWNEELDAKGSKFQPNRILITHTNDLTVHFYDMSTQLLLTVRPDPVDFDFPNPLPHLTIDLNLLVYDPAVAERIVPRSDLPVAIHSVHFASESLEVVVTLSTGDLFVFRLYSGQHDPGAYRKSTNPEFVYLDHLTLGRGYRYSPFVMFSPAKGSITACANCDVGFMAVGYSDGSLYVIDLRGPTILLRQGPESKAKRHSIVPLGHRSVDPITSLTWTVSPLSTDKNPGLRLIAIRNSGPGEVYTLQRGANSAWTCSPSFKPVDAIADPLPEGTFVVDRKSGVDCRATRLRLSNVLDPISTAPTYLIVASTKGVKTFDAIDGDRIGRVDWGTKTGNLKTAKLVGRLGQFCALVALTDRHEGLVYSVPHLELICTVSMPPTVSSLSVDKSGDFVGWNFHPRSGMVQSAVYGTVFNMRRALPMPDFDLTATKGSVPAQPQPVSMAPASLLGTWFAFGNQSVSGAQIDELFGGPNRPIPQPKPEVTGNSSFSGVSQGAASLAASASATQSSLYNRLTSALNDRGQMLGNLEDQFNSLEQGSRSMAEQAKRLAAEQTAKQWFKFG